MLLLILFIILLFGVFCLGDSAWAKDTTCITAIILIGCVIGLFFFNVAYNPISYNMQYNTIQGKIDMYSDENKEINSEIKSVVIATYKNEVDLYRDLKDKTITELITMYPNVKSVNLVNKQISIYVKNKNNLNKLKESKIELESQRILYKLW